MTSLVLDPTKGTTWTRVVPTVRGPGKRWTPSRDPVSDPSVVENGGDGKKHDRRVYNKMRSRVLYLVRGTPFTSVG